MEFKKEIQKYTKGEFGDVHHINIALTSPFGVNSACEHAYKKTERLLIALHLVTNFVPDTEPARHSIRQKSIHLLSDILSLRSGLRSVGSGKVDSVVVCIHEILSLLEVVHASGFISDMNKCILRDEFLNLILFLREVEDHAGAESLKLDDSYFHKDNYNHKGQNNIKDKTDKHQLSLKDKKTTPHPKGQNKVQKRHHDRRSDIIAVIKDKKTVTVKDIRMHVAGCSEKTLQRELMKLVSEGVLKKEGERRWSTYSLA